MAYENGKLLSVKKEDGSFMAGANHDKKFMIEDQISVFRWNDFQKLQIVLSYGLSFETLFQKHKEAFDLLNSLKLGEAAVIMHEVMQGVKNMSAERIPTALKLCALFINREDEDRRTITNSMVEEKIKDWSEAGYDMNSFFHLALHSTPGFIKAFEKDTQSISQQ